MSEDIVSFKLAKLARKKGFDWITRVGDVASLYDKKGEYTPYTNYGFMYSGLNEGYIYAPNQSFLQKWLREKKKIYIEVSHFTKQPVDSKVWKDAYQFFINGEAFHPYYRDYEECLEAALMKALKQLPDGK